MNKRMGQRPRSFGPLGGPAGERGSISSWVIVSVFAMFVIAGLAIDMTGKVNAEQRAFAVAAEAARTGGQQVAAPAAVRGQSVAADPAQAHAAAQDYLAGANLPGSVQIIDGARIAVTVHDTYSTKFLSMIGISTLPVDAKAEARLTRVMGGVEQ